MGSVTPPPDTLLLMGKTLRSRFSQNATRTSTEKCSDGSECYSPVTEQPMLFGYRTFMDAGQMRTEDFIYGRMQSGLRSLRIAASVKSK